MPHSEPVLWQELYRAALTESDPEKLTQHVLDAESALFRRGLQLDGSSNHHEERGAMNQAAADLLVLKIHKLGWPSPKSKKVKA
jgi:hypothetical protein